MMMTSNFIIFSTPTATQKVLKRTKRTATPKLNTAGFDPPRGWYDSYRRRCTSVTALTDIGTRTMVTMNAIHIKKLNPPKM